MKKPSEYTKEEIKDLQKLKEEIDDAIESAKPAGVTEVLTGTGEKKHVKYYECTVRGELLNFTKRTKFEDINNFLESINVNPSAYHNTQRLLKYME